MASVDAETRKYWKQNPAEVVSILIRVDGDVADRLASLEKMGVEIKRRFRLTSSISGSCTARVALKVAGLSWVTGVEPDRKMRIFGR
jgi:hypothetical protein